MALVTTKELMLDAQKNHYAIGAFNAENMEMVQAIIAAAEELRAPVIVQTTPGTLKYASPAMFHAMVAAAASEATVPVVMHLDHGSSYELAMKAFRAGYTSVMIDGSHHVFEENIEITKEVVRACHAAGIPVEAELGKVGGKEDDLDGGNGNGYTVPSEAAEFVERTGVDSLAVARMFARCQLMASPSRSGSVASSTPSACLALLFNSLMSFSLPLMLMYCGA